MLELSRSLLLLLSFFLACATHQTQTAQTQDKGNMGTLQGKFSVGPLHPGPQRIDEDNSDAASKMFASHKIVILSAKDKSKIKEVAIDSKGAYKVDLPAGEYLVDIEPADIGMRKLPPRSVTIQAGKSTNLDLDFDTGMR